MCTLYFEEYGIKRQSKLFICKTCGTIFLGRYDRHRIYCSVICQYTNIYDEYDSFNYWKDFEMISLKCKRKP